ncbi:FUSC family protein [Stutzerimonas nitrititolerans]|uniref:FUSC family protein n=1 Tax=Stutzerimonas nitrititolerans TaxID=2482751 RepID=UPI0028AC45D1|nr:FUSC family protein [Stutzerimonas nitrititolerans]
MKSTLLHYFDPDLRSLLFACKGLAAVTLALAVSMSLDLDKPFWAMVASMMLQARPQAGLVMEKALFLVLGSVTGAAIALWILDHLMPYPVLAIGCLALCVAATTAVSATMRHVNFVFGTTLVGVTAMLVVMFAMADPVHVSSESIFLVVRARIGEVLVGASCAVLASVLFPLKVETLLTGHTRRLLDACLEHTASVASASPDQSLLHHQRFDIITCAATISEDSNAGRYEEAGNVSAALTMANRALTVLAAARSLERFLPSPPGHESEPKTGLVDECRRCLTALPTLDDVSRAESLETMRCQLVAQVEAQEVPSDLNNVATLRAALGDMLSASAALNDRTPYPNRVARFMSHRDPLVGLRAAIRSVSVFLSCVAVWWLSEGPVGLVMMLVLPVLFAQMFAGAPNAALVVRRILIGSLLAIPVSIPMGLGLLAQGTGSFEILLLVLAGPLFLGLMAMTSPALTPYGLGFCLSIAVLIQPNNYMTFAAEQSLVTGLGIVSGLGLLFLGFELIGPPKGSNLQRRIVEAMARDLSTIGSRNRDEKWFNRRMAERLLYLRSFAPEDGQQTERWIELGFVALELGHELASRQCHLGTRPGESLKNNARLARECSSLFRQEVLLIMESAQMDKT